jgi:hypothetical protein
MTSTCTLQAPRQISSHGNELNFFRIGYQMTTSPIKWTYSSMKTFKTCARQYKEKYITKSIKFTQNEAGIYGDKVHKAFEDFFLKAVPIPPEFQRFWPMVEPTLGWPGEMHIEKEMALGFDLEPCPYWGDYFVRGKADYFKVYGKNARLLDWKTSKTAKYADIKQNELMSLLVFKHFPEVEVVTTGLVFLVPNKLIKAKFHRKDEHAMWQRWLYDVSRIESAVERDNFGPTPSGLCKQYCDVLSCEHNGRMMA